MTRKRFPHFIIISGSGKKVGKTYLATALILAFSAQFPVVALKISPHVHDSLGNTELHYAAGGFRIFRDLSPHHKNSGQFLEAGAIQSFFMETEDQHLAVAFDVFIKECNPLNLPVICESGALNSLIQPGISVFITHTASGLPEHKRAAMLTADLVLPAKSFSAQATVDQIDYFENRWCLHS
jgi:hypothetical protein